MDASGKVPVKFVCIRLQDRLMKNKKRQSILYECRAPW